MNTTMIFLKPLDWITCRGYYVFRSLNYADWNAKFTAILYSQLVLSCLSMAVIDAILLRVSPQTLQAIYSKGDVTYILGGGVMLGLLHLRYYVFCKDCIPQGIDVKEARSNFWKNLLYVVVILVLSVAGLVLMQEYIKSQGIVFGLLFNVKRGLWFFL